MGAESDRSVDVDLDCIEKRLREYPLSIAVVFGSVGRGDAHRLSDLDVGVVFEDDLDRRERFRHLDRLTAALADVTGRDAVDVVDLESAPPAIGYEALADGVLILGDEGDATALEARLLSQKLDFAPVKREWAEALETRLDDGSYGRA